MDKDDFTFEQWFSSLSILVLDKCGVDFQNKDSVRGDYEAGKNCADVADDIVDVYTCD